MHTFNKLLKGFSLVILLFSSAISIAGIVWALEDRKPYSVAVNIFILLFNAVLMLDVTGGMEWLERRLPFPVRMPLMIIDALLILSAAFILLFLIS